MLVSPLAWRRGGQDLLLVTRKQDPHLLDPFFLEVVLVTATPPAAES